MKKENISQLFSDIDDKFIEEAADARKKASPVIKYITAAACIAVVAIIGIVISRSDFVSPPVSTEAITNEAGNGDKNVPEIVTSPAIYYESATEIGSGEEIEMAIVPRWDDLTTSEKYTEIKLGDTAYGTADTKIDKEKTSSFISEAVASGYDIYEDKTYTEACEAYAIAGISTDCAVAVKIGNENEYYVYINHWYAPATLGDFIADLNLRSTVSFGKAYIDVYTYDALSTGHSQRIYADFDDNEIWQLLSDVTDSKNVEYNKPYDRINIETDLPLLGFRNISFCITPDGYIITNILSTQKCFFVGTEKYDTLAEYLKKNVPFKDNTTVYEHNADGTVPGKGEEITSPPYNPAEAPSTPAYVPERTETVTSAKPSVSDNFIVEETTKR